MIAFEKAIARLEAVFGAPKTSNIEIFLDEYRRVIGKNSPEVLELGISKAIDAQESKYPRWPTPGECGKHCQAASLEIANLRRRHVQSQPETYPEPTPEAKARVAAMLQDYKSGKKIEPVPGDDEPHDLTPTSKRITGDDR